MHIHSFMYCNHVFSFINSRHIYLGSIMTWLLISVLLLGCSFAQFNHTLSPLHMNSIKMSVVTDEISYSQSVNLLFNVNNAINAKVYESDEALLSDNIHNSSFYSLSQSCALYPPQIQFINFGVYDLTTYVWDSALIGSHLYILESLPNSELQASDHSKGSQISLYTVNEDQVQFTQVILKASDLGLKDLQEDQILLANINDNLYFTDGAKIYVYDTAKRAAIVVVEVSNTNLNTNQQLASGDLLKFGAIKTTKGSKLFQLVMTTKIVIMEVLSFESYKEVLRVGPSEGKSFFDAGTDNEHYFTLEDSTVNVFSLDNLSGGKSTFNLESAVCAKMAVRSYVVYLVCQEHALNYVAELYYMNSTFYLNKYWNHMPDVKNVFVEGEMVFLVGDEDSALMHIGIHRQVLLDLNKEQPKYTHRSFGLEKIETIMNAPSVSKHVGVGVDFLSLFSLIKAQPALACTFPTKVNKHNILVAFNTTDFNATPVTVDQILFPFVYYQSSLPVTQQSSLLLTILGLLFALSILFLLLGCYCRNKAIALKAIQHLSKKLQELKNKRKEMKPL